MSRIQVNPKVSAIVLSYNHEKYIFDALTSVYNQDYDNFEIIIRDDGSKDKSPQIISNFISTHKPLYENVNVNFVEVEQNEGLIRSYNDLLSKATGEIVVVFAGDDISYESRIKETVEFLLKHNVDLVACSAKLIDFKGTDIYKSNVDKHANDEQKLDENFNKDYRKIKGYSANNILVNLGGYGFTFRKNLFISPVFLPEKALAEDHYISFLAIINSGAILWNKVLLEYRIHNTSISSIEGNKYSTVSKYLLRKESNAKIILEYIEKNRNNKLFRDSDVVTILKQEIFRSRFIINYCNKSLISNILLIINLKRRTSVNIFLRFKYLINLFIPFLTERKINLYHKALIDY
jgi:glycosyltransferase involved in cell wall biosynthesis